MRTTTKTAITLFHQGKASPPSQRGTSIWTDGETIWSYGTALVTRLSSHGFHGYALNMTTYSRTTTDKQSSLRRELQPSPVQEVYDVDRGAGPHTLMNYALHILRTTQAADAALTAAGLR